jgi:outer membrane protein TolC
MPRINSALLLLLLPTALGAQEASSVTEERFLAAVTGDHPAAEVLTEERGLAAAEVKRASLLPNLAIEVSREDPDRAARETTAGVTWTPPIDGRRALGREVAEKGLAAAEGRLDANRLRLRLQLRATYADWFFAWQRRELAAGQLAQVGELAERARARAEAGEIPGLAARRFTLEAAQARADLGRAEAALAAARASVAAWYPALPRDARPLAPLLPPAPAAAAGLGIRADLTALERELERAEVSSRLARRVFEAPALGLGWKRIEEGPVDTSGPVLSSGWSLPLFDRRQADRLAAEARLAAARAELKLARGRVEAERAGALAAYARLRSEADEAAQAAAEGDATLTGAAAAYQAGESGLTDFLDAVRAVLAIRETALEIQQAALAAHRDLEAAAGRPLTSEPGDLQ